MRTGVECSSLLSMGLSGCFFVLFVVFIEVIKYNKVRRGEGNTILNRIMCIIIVKSKTTRVFDIGPLLFLWLKLLVFQSILRRR